MEDVGLTQDVHREATMQPMTGTIHAGQIVPDGTLDWPEGTKVDIVPRPTAGRKMGLDPSEWRDDSESLADWEAWIATFEPLEFTPEEEAELARFRKEMRRFNIEAVRRQMEEGER
jgi:hypothetical protein